MKLKNIEDARFVVPHQVTEKKLLHLEKGVRKLGFQSGGNRIMTVFLGLAVFCLLLSRILGGIAAGIAGAFGAFMLLAFLAGVYALWRGWTDAKREIKQQVQSGEEDFDFRWEYRFFEDCYEAIGKDEKISADYSNIQRLIDMSGMLVLVEKGNQVRYFMKDDTEKGDGRELAGFLERKSGTKLEFVSVR